MSISQCASVPPLVSASRPSTRGLSRVPTVLPRRTLRQILNRALGTPSQLDAFLIDYFPDIFRQTSGSMDRESKLNLLLQEDSETHLTSLVHKEFPQEVAETLVQEKLQSLQMSRTDPELTLQIPADEQRVKYTVILTGTIDDMDRHMVEALLRHMRRYASDAELTIEAIRAGSIILTCTGTQYGLQKLFEDFEQGRLPALMEFPVIDIVQNLPNTRLPHRPVRKSRPPVFDPHITAQFAWPTVAERIEEHKTLTLQADATQVLRLDAQHCCPEPSACGQSYVTRKMKVLPVRRKKKLMLWLLGVAACAGVVSALQQGLQPRARRLMPSGMLPAMKATHQSPAKPDSGVSVATDCERDSFCDQSLGIAMTRLCMADSPTLQLESEWRLQRQGPSYVDVSRALSPPQRQLAQQLAQCLSQHLRPQLTAAIQRWPSLIVVQPAKPPAMPRVRLPNGTTALTVPPSASTVINDD